MRHIMIFGGTGGIGAAMVRRFAAAGDGVSLTWNAAEEKAASLEKETGARAYHADITRPEQVRAAAAAAESAFGPPEVVICAAGVGLNRMLADTTDEEYRRVMDTNVYGPFCVMREVMPGMFWRRKGVILTVSSIWGQTGASCEGVYSAAKAAVIGLTRAAAKEVAESGVRVNCIAPGLIDTPMNDHLSAEEKRALTEEIPLGRAGLPAEVAETAFFLAGEGAAYITGQVIPVNGGWYI